MHQRERRSKDVFLLLVRFRALSTPAARCEWERYPDNAKKRRIATKAN